METKSIITVFGTEEEKADMRAIKNAAAGKRNLSWSDFILEHFGIRKAPALDRLESAKKANLNF